MAGVTTFLVSGTRGDVQPLVALARGLQGAGVPVRVATHAPFRALVERAGVAFAELTGNPSELLQAPGGRDALTLGRNPLRNLAATLRYVQQARPVMARLLASAWRASQGAGALVVTLPTTWGGQIAAALGVPCVWALLQPVGETSMFPSPLQPCTLAPGGLANRLSHRLVEQSLWRPWRHELNAWRREMLGLQPLPVFRSLPGGPAPRLFGFSQHVVPRPADWPAHYHVCGYWFLNIPPGWQPPARVAAFLAAGPPPVYASFGSVANAHTYAGSILAALEGTGQRLLLAGSGAGPLPGWALAVEDLPHDWLFPQVALVISHGGAGTTAAALRAGVPVITVPFGADQRYWGARVAALGCGPAPIPAHRLTSQRLVDALAEARDPAVRAAAAHLGAALRAEDGIAHAVALLRATIARV